MPVGRRGSPVVNLFVRATSAFYNAIASMTATAGLMRSYLVTRRHRKGFISKRFVLSRIRVSHRSELRPCSAGARIDYRRNHDIGSASPPALETAIWLIEWICEIAAQ